MRELGFSLLTQGDYAHGHQPNLVSGSLRMIDDPRMAARNGYLLAVWVLENAGPPFEQRSPSADTERWGASEGDAISRLFLL